MPDWLKGIIVILVLCIAVTALGLMNSQNLSGDAHEGIKQATDKEPPTTLRLPERKLSCYNIDGSTFEFSVVNAKKYTPQDAPTALVVPHHLTAGILISGALEAASGLGDYESVIIVAPNHEADIDDVVLTDKGWSVGDGVDCDTSMLEALTSGWSSSAGYALNDEKLEDDHSASVLIPFIDKYFEDTPVLPILVSKSLTLDETLYLADTLYSIIEDCEKSTLLVCSIDFSHYLTPEQSRVKDRVTLEAIQRRDYTAIYSFTNDNLDSPASLIIFLRYLELCGKSVTVLDNTDASSFSDTPVASTTSYFILAG